MAILAFQKPDKVIMQKANDFDGTFEFRPLEPGFGVTIGNVCVVSYFHHLKVMQLLLFVFRE